MRVVVLTEEQDDLLFALINEQNHRLTLEPGQGKIVAAIIGALANAYTVDEGESIVITGGDGYADVRFMAT